MRFSLEEALILDKALNDMGETRNINFYDDDFKFFDADMLRKITCITIESCDDIDFLSKLPNLREVKIVNRIDYSMVIDGCFEDNTYFNHIQSFEVLKKLSNLESIYIEKDISIEQLDLRGLSRLREVVLIDNPRLKSVLGLDEQHRLEKVIIYGSRITDFPNIDSYFANTIDANINILDISVFFTFIKDLEDARRIYDMDLQGLVNLEFAEKNGLVSYTKLSIAQAVELYVKFTRLFTQKDLFFQGDNYKLKYVFDYVCNNIRFAQKELESRDEHYESLMSTYGEIPTFFQKNIGFLHNSYSTFHFRKGNCEGVVNLMRFMLSILGIESEDINCHDRRFKYSIANNHAILRAKCDGNWYYYDATYDRKNSNDYYGLTLEEAARYLDLSIFEREIMTEGNRDETKRRTISRDFTKK